MSGAPRLLGPPDDLADGRTKGDEQNDGEADRKQGVEEHQLLANTHAREEAGAEASALGNPVGWRHGALRTGRAGAHYTRP
jgi:hypothetical protein